MNARRVGRSVAALVVVFTAAVVGNTGASINHAMWSDPATPGIIQCPLDLPGCRITPHPGQL